MSSSSDILFECLSSGGGCIAGPRPKGRNFLECRLGQTRIAGRKAVSRQPPLRHGRMDIPCMAGWRHDSIDSWKDHTIPDAPM